MYLPVEVLNLQEAENASGLEAWRSLGVSSAVRLQGISIDTCASIHNTHRGSSQVRRGHHRLQAHARTRADRPRGSLAIPRALSMEGMGEYVWQSQTFSTNPELHDAQCGSGT